MTCRIIGGVMALLVAILMVLNFCLFDGAIEGDECTPTWMYKCFPHPEILQARGSRIVESWVCFCLNVLRTAWHKDKRITAIE